MKKLLFLAVAVLLACWTFRPTGDFSVGAISHDRSYDERWGVYPLQDDVKKALDQKFIYSGAGAQVFVFFSEDQNYVLKFFKKRRLEAPFWIRALPMPGLHYKKRKIAGKEANLIKDFTSYKLAFDFLQDETALLLVHLNPTGDLQRVKLVDGKKTYEIDLDKFDYILQKRGELVCSSIEGFLQKGDVRGAKVALESLLQLFRSRCDKGIADREPNLEKNFAFIGTQAVEIDIGRFSLETPVPPLIRQGFKEWLRSKSPELLTYFEKQYDYFFPETTQL